MPFADLEAARQQCHSMRELVVLHPGGWRDADSLHKLKTMLLAAKRSLGDQDFETLARALEGYAAELFSESDHEKWAQGRTSGADYLRLLILRQLDKLCARLEMIEAVRTRA
jgi:hypothetical protein